MDLGTSETDAAPIALYESAGFTNREGGPDGLSMLYWERDLVAGTGAAEAARSSGRPSGGEWIGPLGRAARLAGGLAAIFIPIALSGVTWWDIGVALALLPVVAAVGAWAMATAFPGAPPIAGDRAREFAAWTRSIAVLAAVLAVEVAATFATPLDGAVAFWIFIGISLVVAALRGDAGCEAVAIPNALSGRKDPTGCIVYAPLDALDARRRRAGAAGAGVNGRR